jgi:hypothetical protein
MVKIGWFFDHKTSRERIQALICAGIHAQNPMAGLQFGNMAIISSVIPQGVPLFSPYSDHN